MIRSEDLAGRLTLQQRQIMDILGSTPGGLTAKAIGLRLPPRFADRPQRNPTALAQTQIHAIRNALGPNAVICADYRTGPDDHRDGLYRLPVTPRG